MIGQNNGNVGVWYDSTYKLFYISVYRWNGKEDADLVLTEEQFAKMLDAAQWVWNEIHQPSKNDEF